MGKPFKLCSIMELAFMTRSLQYRVKSPWSALDRELQGLQITPWNSGEDRKLLPLPEIAL
jgi:hypothetical protein